MPTANTIPARRMTFPVNVCGRCCRTVTHSVVDAVKFREARGCVGSNSILGRHDIDVKRDVFVDRQHGGVDRRCDIEIRHLERRFRGTRHALGGDGEDRLLGDDPGDAVNCQIPDEGQLCLDVFLNRQGHIGD